MLNFPEVEILLSPPEAIDRRQGDGLIIADNLGAMTGVGLSDGGGFGPQALAALNPTTATSWASTPYTLNIDGLLFARFLKNGRVIFGASAPTEEVDLAGFYIDPRTAAYDCKIGDNAGAFDGGNTDLNWTAIKGTWKTTMQLKPTGGTCILNTGSQSFARAKTTGNLPKNRCFIVDLYLLGTTNKDSLPDGRLQWGDGWALRLTDEQVPRLERMVTTTNPTTLLVTKSWQTVRGFEGARPVNARGGHYRIVIMRLAGRLVIEIGGRAFWFLDPYEVKGQKKMREVKWDAAPVYLEVANARCRLEFAALKWSEPDGSPFVGHLTRAVTKHANIAPGSSSTGRCAGWLREGTSAQLGVSPGADVVTCNVTLRANTDGIDTPFLTKYSARFIPVWVSPRPNPIDVRYACKKLSISLGMPPQVAGSEATITLDRTALDRNHPNWERYAKMHNPVEIRIRRTGESSSRVFSGYIFKPAKEMGGRLITLTLRDPIVRLQKVGEVYNALVDHRYAPLDLLFAEQLTDAFSNGGYDPSTGEPKSQYGGLYLAQCVQMILSIALGQGVADTMNGNGDPLRFLPHGWPPLLTPENDVGGWIFIESIGTNTSPIAGGAWMLPPPFGDDVFSWIAQLAKRDHCVFYYGWPPGYEGALPVFVYGRLPQILGARETPLHTLKDVKVGDNWERLMKTANVEERPERDLNEVIVWGAEEPGFGGLLPSLRISQHRFDDSDPRAGWRSWDRPILIRDPIAFLAAEAIGQGVIDQLQGVDLKWPTFEFEGDEQVAPNHLVTPHFEGNWVDPSLNMEGQWFRAETVSHVIDFSDDAGKFTTAVSPRPLSALEERAFSRGHLV